MGHGKKGIILQNLGSTFSPNKRCLKSNRPNGVHSQLQPPTFLLSPQTGKAFLLPAVSSSNLTPNSPATLTKSEPFPPLLAIHPKDDIQAQSSDHEIDIPKQRKLTKPLPRLAEKSGLKLQPLEVAIETAEDSRQKQHSLCSESPSKELVTGYGRMRSRPRGKRRPGRMRDLGFDDYLLKDHPSIMDQDFEYCLKKDHPSDYKEHRRVCDLQRGSVLVKQMCKKRPWTEEAIKEGKDVHYWRQMDEQEIRDAVYRNYKGRYLARKKDQAIKHLMEEKLYGASKKTHVHRKPWTQRWHRKPHKSSKKAEIAENGVPETQRPRRKWNIRSRHHFRSFDHRRLRRKPKVFDFIFEKMKPCFKVRRDRMDSVGHEHDVHEHDAECNVREHDAEHDIQEHDAKHDIRQHDAKHDILEHDAQHDIQEHDAKYVQEDAIKNSDVQISPQPSTEQMAVQMADILLDTTVTVEKSAINVTVDQGITKLEVAAIETKIVSEATTVLPDGALMRSEEELTSVQNMFAVNDGDFVNPVLLREQVTEYPEQATRSWENLGRSSGVATIPSSDIPTNHDIHPHLSGKQAPRVLERRSSRTGFNIYQDVNRVRQQTMGTHSRIPVSIPRNEAPTGRHGVFVDKQNVQLDLTKTNKTKMFSKIPVAVAPVLVNFAPQLRSARSLGTFIGSDQENMTTKPSIAPLGECRAALKTKPKRTNEKRTSQSKESFYKGKIGNWKQ